MKKKKNDQYRKALEYLKADKRLTIKELAAMGECSTRHIQSILSGTEKKGISRTIGQAIAIGLDTTYEDMLSLGRHILDGNDPAGWRPISINVGIRVISPGEKKMMTEKTIPRNIPIISWVQAGEWQDIVNEFHPGDADEFIPVFKNVSDGTFALRITGYSMAPDFLPGDIIVVDPAVPPETGRFVIAKVENGNNENGEATFKQFVRDGNQVYLRPLNDKFETLNMTGINFKVIGCVVQKTQDY